jgi:hypothetical protein
MKKQVVNRFLFFLAQMKEEREKRNDYIKIMYKEPLLVSYTLGNTITTLKGWLNVGNLM